MWRSRNTPPATPVVATQPVGIAHTVQGDVAQGGRRLSASGGRSAANPCVVWCALTVVLMSYAAAAWVGYSLGSAIGSSEAHAEAEARHEKEWQDSTLGFLQSGAEATWGVVSSVGSAVTERAAGALQASAAQLGSLLHLSEEMIAQLLTAVGNLGFCAILTLGFFHLPPDVMLVVGLVTFIIGPALFLVFLRVVGAVCSLAAGSPALYVLLLFVVSFSRSQLAQTLGKRLGLDVTGDGRVTWRDALHTLVGALRERDWYASLKASVAQTGWVRLEDIEDAERRIVQPSDLSLSHSAASADEATTREQRAEALSALSASSTQSTQQLAALEARLEYRLDALSARVETVLARLEG
jgi:hypothetical protein